MLAIVAIFLAFQKGLAITVSAFAPKGMPRARKNWVCADNLHIPQFVLS